MNITIGKRYHGDGYFPYFCHPVVPGKSSRLTNSYQLLLSANDQPANKKAPIVKNAMDAKILKRNIWRKLLKAYRFSKRLL